MYFTSKEALMILIAKQNIKEKELYKIIPTTHRFYFPKKKQNYEGTVIFTEGHSYRLKEKNGVGTIQSEAGVFFIYAKGDGDIIPQELFRIFSK